MKFFASTLALISLALTPAMAAPATAAAVSVSVSYDTKYDVAGSSLNTVACSDGVNGLVTQGYTTFGSLPKFPLIGGAPTIPGWNSPNCGNCYSLHYKAGKVDKTIYVTAIDAAPGGFNLGLQAMNQLTNNQGTQLGRVQATYALADPSKCGF
ncbi:allergenic cerato-platanin Asp F13 [Aspergillus melleus]|uniref:allergenic cerato-platanin Asp F13 n=1 Tax=Aspergillus melleus TaxID=138277 RepID=UPI001E8D8236|nr:uncharacterized protein LDX57_002541 [Aspergillus melleus]KAH8424798.1 hypothetical protein LDX57_002541 [Aspergillus melleus]